MIYHTRRDNVWSIHYCIVFRACKEVNLEDFKDNLQVLLKETLTAWDCEDIGSYFFKDSFIIKIDAPVNLELSGFVNAFKTRSTRLCGAGVRGLWKKGYFVATVSDSSQPELDYINREEKEE